MPEFKDFYSLLTVAPDMFGMFVHGPSFWRFLVKDESKSGHGLLLWREPWFASSSTLCEDT